MDYSEVAYDNDVIRRIRILLFRKSQFFGGEWWYFRNNFITDCLLYLNPRLYRPVQLWRDVLAAFMLISGGIALQ